MEGTRRRGELAATEAGDAVTAAAAEKERKGECIRKRKGLILDPGIKVNATDDG